MRRASIRGCNRSESRRLERITSRAHGIAGAIAVYCRLQDECEQRLVRRLLAFDRRNCTLVADGRRRKARGVGTTGRAQRFVITTPGTALTMRVLERGWVSSNNVLLFDDNHSATLVDTGYVTHSEQTLALVRHALEGRRLARIINTHLHSDHCGGNALLSRELNATIAIPPGHAEAVACWDDATLGYSACGQTCDRFSFDSVLQPGERTMIGGAEWQALASPGHDPHSIILWNAEN